MNKIYLYSDETISKETLYTYDVQLNPVRTKITYIGRIAGEVNIHVLSYEYEYDSNSRITVKKEFMDNDLRSTETCTYDANGNTVSLEAQ